MTKFIHITDSHWGVDDEKFNTVNYHLQQGYPDRAQDIIDAMCCYIEKENIDFIVHSGDITDDGSEQQIQLCKKLFANIPVPLYLCLGNHDLPDLQARDRWLDLAPEFFPSAAVDFTVISGDCHIHFVPNQWTAGSADYHWVDEQYANLCAEQMAFLRHALAQQTDTYHFIVTHSPVHAIDEGQVGPAVGRHPSNEDFTNSFRQLSQEFPHLRAVIAGHSHHNMYVNEHDCHFVTTSALLESPFDCKIFTVDNAIKSIDMYAHSLAADVQFETVYDHNINYAQGRMWDRSFNEKDGVYMKKDDI
ncbi:MAG: metallophosphoesterase [Planctomycetes bacterium]|nr:metallophosphoesterase [Planctomycetota bacterium]